MRLYILLEVTCSATKDQKIARKRDGESEVPLVYQQ